MRRQEDGETGWLMFGAGAGRGEASVCFCVRGIHKHDVATVALNVETAPTQ